MPRKLTGTIWTKTLIVRLGVQQDEDLRSAAEGLGMDVSNLVRLILTEHLPSYLERAESASRRAEAARAKVGKGAGPGRQPKGKSVANPGPTASDGRATRCVDL